MMSDMSLHMQNTGTCELLLVHDWNLAPEHMDTCVALRQNRKNIFSRQKTGSAK
jgi:ABC-type phosphate/phosphonate transport system ATPase subunit